ncbi:hypothetical protein BDR03DRAFT_946323 [Suillus americanus]|nr:hypothetical protein BDR03DRAFT_946323 [Suillus americanus]
MLFSCPALQKVSLGTHLRAVLLVFAYWRALSRSQIVPSVARVYHQSEESTDKETNSCPSYNSCAKHGHFSRMRSMQPRLGQPDREKNCEREEYPHDLTGLLFLFRSSLGPGRYRRKVSQNTTHLISIALRDCFHYW